MILKFRWILFHGDKSSFYSVFMKQTPNATYISFCCCITVISRKGPCFHERVVEHNNLVVTQFPDTVTDPNLTAHPHDRQTALLIMKQAWSDWGRGGHLCT